MTAMLMRGDVVRRIKRGFPNLQLAHLPGDLVLDVIDPATGCLVVVSPVVSDAKCRLSPGVLDRRVEIEKVGLHRQRRDLGVHAEAASITGSQVFLEFTP